MRASGKPIANFMTGVMYFVAVAALIVLAYQTTYAAGPNQITNRSLTLQDGATDGGSKPLGVVKHQFTFTLPDTTAIQSIKFQYCTTAEINIGGPCVTPAGLVTTAATLGTQSGLTFTSLVNTTNGSPYVTSSSALTPSPTTPITVQLLTVTNPSGSDCGAGVTNCTFFVRISTYASTDTSGSPIDAGTVAAAVSTQIVLTGTMPESLIFCTGGQISTTSGVPDCTTATSGNVTFNQLFSPTATAYATSQMAASTNALSGYVITVGGGTLTSGTNSITAIGATSALSTIGTAQFGMNLAADTAAPVLTPASADVTPAPNGTNFMGKATTSFGTGGALAAAKYAFNGAAINTIAKSDNGTGTGAPTDSQIYTSTYIVNVSGSQPAGTYKTTLTYICTPTF